MYKPNKAMQFLIMGHKAHRTLGCDGGGVGGSERVGGGGGAPLGIVVLGGGRVFPPGGGKGRDDGVLPPGGGNGRLDGPPGEERIGQLTQILQSDWTDHMNSYVYIIGRIANLICVL